MTVKASVVLWVLLLPLASLAQETDSTTTGMTEVEPWWTPTEEQIETARDRGVPVAACNSLGMEFALIPAGRFLMGAPADEDGRFKVETQHWVTLTRLFYLAATEVTQEQFQAVMGFNPCRFAGAGGTAPVEQVTWFDAIEFCNRLSRGENLQEGYFGFRPARCVPHPGAAAETQPTDDPGDGSPPSHRFVVGMTWTVKNEIVMPGVEPLISFQRYVLSY